MSLESGGPGDHANRLRIAVVGCVGLPAKYGGFETLAENLTDLPKSQFDVHVYCSAKRYKQRVSHYRGARLHYIPLDANGASSIFYDVWSMIHASRYADVILVLGVSGCIFLPALRLASKAKIVVNVDGIEWKRAKWNRVARRFLRFSERVGAACANNLIADNLEIKKYIDDRYGVDATCIEYGGDHASRVAICEADFSEFPFLESPYAVKVCRIEPENNIEMILDAFARVQLPLVLIGNWGMSGYGKDLRQRFAGFDHLHMLDPIYDEQRLNMIRSNATIYVHGHSAGGTNPSLVEAMWLGLPAIVFDVGYNRATTDDQAMYFQSADDLAAIVEKVNDAKLEQVASAMKSVAEQRYTWKAIKEKYQSLLYAQ